MTAGIVVYERRGRSLEGYWTHTDIGGVRAREVVHDVGSDQIAGNWAVDVYMPGGTAPFFSGRLEIRALSDALVLEWTGTRTADGGRMHFTGIGVAVGTDKIAATFEQVPVGS